MELTPQQRCEMMSYLQRALACTSDYVEHALPRWLAFDSRKWCRADLTELRRIRGAFGPPQSGPPSTPGDAERARMIVGRFSLALEGIENGVPVNRIRHLVSSGLHHWVDGMKRA